MTYDPFRRVRSLPWLCFGVLVFSSVLIADVPGSQDRGGQGRSGGGTPQNPSTVEFLVVGNDGQPVTDLKAEEVSLRIAGRDRKIESLELKRFTSGAGGGAAAAPAAPPPFATNAGGGAAAAPGRVFMFVIEDQSVRPGDERPIRASIEKLLETLAPNDRVGIMTTPNPTVRLDPTTDRARLKEALGRVAGQRPGSMSSGDRACRTRDSLVALRNVLPSLGSEGSLATVVFFSSQLEQAATGGASTSGAGCMVSTDLFQGIASTSAASRAHVYVVQAEESVSQRSEGLENLASVSGGGQVYPLVSSGDPVERIARETAAYYVATFRPEQNDRVGGGQRLELRVSRSGVHARSYGEYTFRAGSVAGDSAASARDMLKTTSTFTDLPVRVHASVSLVKGDELKVMITAEPEDPSVKLTEAAVGIVDAKNQMQVAAFEADQLGMRPLAITLPLPASPGHYRIRFAAKDASGKGGAADYQVNAELVSAGPLKMSDLLLGAAPDGKFSIRMQFKDEPAAIAILELYGPITAQVSGRMEIASSVDGPAIETFPLGSQPSGDPERNNILSELKIGSLKPGDYVVRAILKMGDGPEGRVIRTLRKVQ